MFMALVICFVFLTPTILFLTTFKDGIGYPLCFVSLLELFEGRLEPLFDVLVQGLQWS
jgi:hypothetical protein